MRACGLKRRLAIVVMFAWVLVGLVRFEAGPALAAGGIHVTPARVEAVIGPDGVAPPLTVHNHMDRAIGIHVTVGWGSHDLHGVPIYSAEPPRPDVVVKTEPDHLLLLPGAQAEIQVQVDPADQPLYPVIFVAWRPVWSGWLTETEFHAVTRIAVPFLLTPEDHPPGAVRMIDTTVTEIAPHTVEVVAIVRNDGVAHGKTAGELVVLDEAGSVSALLPLPEVFVLPGAERLLRMVWQTEEPVSGQYTIRFDGFPGEALAALEFSLYR